MFIDSNSACYIKQLLTGDVSPLCIWGIDWAALLVARGGGGGREAKGHGLKPRVDQGHVHDFCCPPAAAEIEIASIRAASSGVVQRDMTYVCFSCLSTAACISTSL